MIQKYFNDFLRKIANDVEMKRLANQINLTIRSNQIYLNHTPSKLCLVNDQNEKKNVFFKKENAN
jgi:hypothetical protein